VCATECRSATDIAAYAAALAEVLGTARSAATAGNRP